MGETKHISIRIPEEILLLVDEQAKRMRWSRNATLNTCIEFGLPDLELESGPRIAADRVFNRTITGIERMREQGGANLVKAIRKGVGNAEIATGGSAGVAADTVLAENKRGVENGDSGAGGELLRGQSVSGAAAAKAGVGGAVRDAEFQEGGGKFRGSGKCPHEWKDWMTCRNNGGGCE